MQLNFIVTKGFVRGAAVAFDVRVVTVTVTVQLQKVPTRKSRKAFFRVTAGCLLIRVKIIWSMSDWYNIW